MSKQSFSLLEGVITVGALVTSAAAVYIAWDQAQTMRVEQHASVFPAIQIDPIEGYSNGGGLTVGFSVENAGVGPAFIGHAKLYKGATPLLGYEEITRIVPSDVDIQFEQLTGRVLAPGVSRNALKLHWREFAIPQEKIDGVYTSTSDWSMEVCYCSTLDRCWISRSGQRVHPHRVETCDQPDETGLF
ncbi:MAG: hypothetical protein CME88_18210 [Hirschia sp.]|nr:hypothetical protein [Hirschia sp.]MBF18537.1 hypothetical protein [Hirschia sp.]MBF20303.1 hypothetical protein [Hirschia sp.]|tara:strand:+ start:863 stop:1426 length:564 start_codon:yes stop_codon:yes gene_type:complete